MLGRPISLLYADQPGIIADAQRCHRERTRVVSQTTVRRHERVDTAERPVVDAVTSAAAHESGAPSVGIDAPLRSDGSMTERRTRRFREIGHDW